jgi:restriction endonuclease S subunit
MSNISGGEVQFQNLQYVDMGTTDVDKYLVRPGDILFNRTNSPDLVGKTGIVREGIPAVFASYLVRLVCDESQVLPDFLNLYLNWEMTQMELRGMATRGVSQANISASVLATLPVPVPERAVQQRTIDLVGAAMRALRTAMGVEVAMEHVYRSVLSLTFDGEGS